MEGRHAAWSSGLDKRKMEEMHLVELSPESKLDNRKVGRHALGLVRYLCCTKADTDTDTNTNTNTGWTIEKSDDMHSAW